MVNCNTWRLPDDYRLDPDWRPDNRKRFDECFDCENPIYEDDEYFEFTLYGRSMIMCPDCAKKWFEECRRYAG